MEVRKPRHFVNPADCARKDCKEPGRYVPVLHFWMDQRHKESPYGKPDKSPQYNRRVCESHKESLDVSDFIDDLGWQVIQRTFMRGRRTVPQRDLTELHFIAVGKGEL